MRYLITLGLILISTTVFAQVYEKEGVALKVTQSVSTVYDIKKIKERIKDLEDYKILAQAQIVKFDQEIADLNKLLTEADKLGIDIGKVTP